ncbi:hypothetical protein ACOMHN_067256 [Nucella lapillus]
MNLPDITKLDVTKPFARVVGRDRICNGVHGTGTSSNFLCSTTTRMQTIETPFWGLCRNEKLAPGGVRVAGSLLSPEPRLAVTSPDPLRHTGHLRPDPNRRQARPLPEPNSFLRWRN